MHFPSALSQFHRSLLSSNDLDPTEMVSLTLAPVGRRHQSCSAFENYPLMPRSNELSMCRLGKPLLAALQLKWGCTEWLVRKQLDNCKVILQA